MIKAIEWEETGNEVSKRAQKKGKRINIKQKAEILNKNFLV